MHNVKSQNQLHWPEQKVVKIYGSQIQMNKNLMAANNITDKLINQVVTWKHFYLSSNNVENSS